MNRRFALFALAAALTLTGGAQAAKPKPKVAAKPRPAVPAPPPAPLGDVVRVALVTELGTIEIDLDHKRAPITVENFVRYVDAKRFDGINFYRAMRLSWGQQPNGLIQAGLQGNPLKIFKPIAHEPTDVTGISHTKGAISMARYAPGTATADFSIMVNDLTGLDADPKSDNPELKAGFAAFGHVSAGMEVVRKIFDAPLSPTKGEGVLKGQMLEPPVKVLTVRRVPIPAPSPTPPATSAP